MFVTHRRDHSGLRTALKPLCGNRLAKAWFPTHAIVSYDDSDMHDSERTKPMATPSHEKVAICVVCLVSVATVQRPIETSWFIRVHLQHSVERRRQTAGETSCDRQHALHPRITRDRTQPHVRRGIMVGGVATVCGESDPSENEMYSEVGFYCIARVRWPRPCATTSHTHSSSVVVARKT